MELGARHWILALGMAAVIHLGLALLFYEPQDGSAQAVGLGGIEVSLGPAGGSPGAASSALEPQAPEVETVQAPEAPLAEPAVETVEAEMPELVEQIPEPVEEIETARAEEMPPQAPEPSVPQPATVLTRLDEVRAQELKPPPPKPKPRPKSKPPPPKPPAPRPPSPPPDRARQARFAQTAPAAPNGAEAGARQQKGAESGNAAPGGGMPGATADYFAHVRAWLERHKRYPRRAQLRRQEGTVLLRFVMDRQGRVLDYRIEQSSGHRLLDNEVEALIERASPLPGIPEEMQQARLELVVPVSFSLR